jgi:hypothetical protein
MSAPVSRLRWVCDSDTGAKVDTQYERAVCELDGEGRTTRWRLWFRDGGRWCPVTPWRVAGSGPATINPAASAGPKGAA